MEKDESELEICVYLGKKHPEVPSFYFIKSISVGEELYYKREIESVEMIEKYIRQMKRFIHERMIELSKDKVCFIYEPPKPKKMSATAIKAWSELEKLGISRPEPPDKYSKKDAEVIFDILRKHFPDARYQE